ncbi:MAG: hypothetical protein MI974_29955 [Chitinophagales bacterium]|nr:hypothetical protein [Chitinophagales bacterium]
MSISLLDVLSCGLAVVVILLIIALNTGKGYDNNPQKISAVELTLNGVYDSPTNVKVTWQDQEERCFIMPISRNLSTIQLTDIIDSLGNFFQSNCYAPNFGSESTSKTQKYDFLFHPSSKGMQLEMNFYSDLGFAIESRMTNVSKGKMIPRAKRMDGLTGSIDLKITYRSGVIVRLMQGELELAKWFLKNVK